MKDLEQAEIAIQQWDSFCAGDIYGLDGENVRAEASHVFGAAVIQCRYEPSRQPSQILQ